MTTHINGIVQTTRKMIAATGTDWDALSEQRFDQVLAAIKDGVDADLIQWAIGINDSHSKVAIQRAIAHAAIAAAHADVEHEPTAGDRWSGALVAA